MVYKGQDLTLTLEAGYDDANKCTSRGTEVSGTARVRLAADQGFVKAGVVGVKHCGHYVKENGAYNLLLSIEGASVPVGNGDSVLKLRDMSVALTGWVSGDQSTSNTTWVAIVHAGSVAVETQNEDLAARLLDFDVSATALIAYRKGSVKFEDFALQGSFDYSKGGLSVSADSVKFVLPCRVSRGLLQANDVTVNYNSTDFTVVGATGGLKIGCDGEVTLAVSAERITAKALGSMSTILTVTDATIHLRVVGSAAAPPPPPPCFYFRQRLRQRAFRLSRL
mmetsp:Transcript_19163/g.47872  ORF Transcript_19163/g.47872 Transcript_19163/m.47872 type:complete len:280 (-) Transcript_19163:908-1747(-)